MDGGSLHCIRDRNQDHPQDKVMQKKPKWLSEEALQITVKRREVKSKGGKERYTHLNAEFQRIARRDKKAFLSDQCKEIEENSRMGKTRDLFKKFQQNFTQIIVKRYLTCCKISIQLELFVIILYK